MLPIVGFGHARVHLFHLKYECIGSWDVAQLHQHGETEWNFTGVVGM